MLSRLQCGCAIINWARNMNEIINKLENSVYPFEIFGTELTEVSTVVILLHGRRQSPNEIYKLGQRINHENITYIIPKAPEKTWYPRGFMRNIEDNQPQLDTALVNLDCLISTLLLSGVNLKKIWLMGFSQGACIVSQYMYDYQRKVAGCFIYTGGLFGDHIEQSARIGNSLSNVQMYLSGSHTDTWVPATRIYESAEIFRSLGAQVEVNIFSDREHIVSELEILVARKWLMKLNKPQTLVA